MRVPFRRSATSCRYGYGTHTAHSAPPASPSPARIDPSRAWSTPGCRASSSCRRPAAFASPHRLENTLYFIACARRMASCAAVFRDNERMNWLRGVSIVLAAVAVTLAAWHAGWLQSFELQAYDALVRRRAPLAPRGDRVVLVGARG